MDVQERPGPLSGLSGITCCRLGQASITASACRIYSYHTHTHTCSSKCNETNLHWYDIPWVISYASSSVSHLAFTIATRLSLLQKHRGDIAELHKLNMGENCLFCPISRSRPYKQVSIVDICLCVYNG